MHQEMKIWIIQLNYLNTQYSCKEESFVVPFNFFLFSTLVNFLTIYVPAYRFGWKLSRTNVNAKHAQAY